MNWEAISAIGQIVGAVGVIISVIYLALQVRSNARQTRLASMRSMSDAFNQWLYGLAGNPQIGDLYYRGMRDLQSIEGADLPRFSALMDSLFRIYEDMYYQKLEGHLDPRVWLGFEAPMRDIIAYPGAQAWWRTRSHWFSREFQQFIDALARAAAPPSLYRERESHEGRHSPALQRWDKREHPIIQVRRGTAESFRLCHRGCDYT